MTIKQQGGIFGRNPTFNTVTALQFVGPISGPTNAAALKSSTTTGLMQITGPATGQTRTMTIPDANFTAARTDAGQTFTGVQVMTSPNIVTSINDTNDNEVFGITATASAVNELTIANAATGNNPTISATGTDTNIGVAITPKGTGNLVLTTGNFVVANGNGIDFSATSGTGTSELFGDYEEGTWTPDPQDSSGNSGSAGTAAGYYTKIGNVVFATVLVENINTTGLTPVDDFRISGLPYTSASLVGFQIFTGDARMNSVTFLGNPNLAILDGTDYIRIVESISGSASDFVIVSEIASGAADIYGTITYMAA